MDDSLEHEDAGDKYAEAEAIVGRVVEIFSERGDLNFRSLAAVREIGGACTELFSRTEARHQEMLQDIKALCNMQKEEVQLEKSQVEQRIAHMRQEAATSRE